MLKQINDSEKHAYELARRLQELPAKVNLIPFNAFPHTHLQRSEDPVIDRFAAILQRKGITTITRRTRGQDIDAACGQLVGRVNDRSRRRIRSLRLERELFRESI
jgi:23S rRNA (adenine2503-C2)-methyltransferase